MKNVRMQILVAALLVVSGIFIATAADVSFLTTGWGKEGTAGTNATVVTGFNLKSVSVFNVSTSNPTIYALMNISASSMSNRVKVASNAIPIYGGYSYTFNADKDTVVNNFAVMTTNGTASYVASGL